MFRIAAAVAVLSGLAWSYEWEPVFPTSPALTDVWRLDSLVAVGVSGHTVWRTVDAGVSWTCDTISGIDPRDDLSDICFADSARGFCRGSKGIVWKTENGGLDWSSSNTSVYNAFDMAFANSDTGLIVGNNGSYWYTHNGGQTWQRGSFNNAYFRSCQPLSGRVWYAAGSGTLAKSTDACSSWTAVPTPALPASPYLLVVHFVDEQRGWFTRMGTSCVFRTPDGGTTWDSICGFAGFSTVQRLAPDTVFGVQSGWYVLRRGTDAGAVWRLDTLDPGFRASACAMLDSKRGWVSDGGSRKLYETDDGWETSRRLDDRTGGFVGALHFFDSADGIVGGFYGMFKRTGDGGKTWEGLESPCGNNVHAFCFTSPADGLLSYSDPQSDSPLYITHDSGHTWQPVPDPDITRTAYTNLAADDNGHIVAHAYRELWVSDDGGESWWQSSLPQDIQTLWEMDFAASGELFVACQDGRIFSSPDYGQTWDEKPTPVTSHLRGLCFADSLHAFACGYDGVLLRSADGGQSWSDTVLCDRTIDDIKFSSPTHGFAVVQGVAILRTVDGGVSWTVDSLSTRNELFRVSMSSSGYKRLFVLDNDNAWLGVGEAVLRFERRLRIATLPASVVPGDSLILIAETRTVNGLELHASLDSVSWERADSNEALAATLLRWEAPAVTGRYLLRVREAYDTTNSRVGVVVVNTSPEWSSQTPDTLNVGAGDEAVLDLAAVCTDADAHPLTFTLEGPDWCVLRNDSLICTPGDSVDTTLTITLVAGDSLNGRAERSLVVAVSPAVSARLQTVMQYAPPVIVASSAGGCVAVRLSLTERSRIVMRMFAVSGRALVDRRITVGPGARVVRIGIGGGIAPGSYLVEVHDGASRVRSAVVLAR
ncbi:MAG: hypothetical protein GF331_08360 [Chitinivibrionales bacterium]|nr:hypothetical protein [Chitinivibrionales bacterium]